MRRATILLAGFSVFTFITLAINPQTLLAEKGRGGRGSAAIAHTAPKPHAAEGKYTQGAPPSHQMRDEHPQVLRKNMPPKIGRDENPKVQQEREHFERARKQHHEALERAEEMRAEHLEKAMEHRARLKEEIYEKREALKENSFEPGGLPAAPAEPFAASNPPSAVTGAEGLSLPAAELRQEMMNKSLSLAELTELQKKKPELFKEYLKYHPELAQRLEQKREERKAEFLEHKDEMRRAAFENRAERREDAFGTPEPEAFHKNSPFKNPERGESKMNMSERPGHSLEPHAHAVSHKMPASKAEYHKAALHGGKK